MVILDNVFLFAAAVAVVAVLIYLSTRAGKNYIFSVAAAVVEFLTVLFLLFRGADIEELFLAVVIYGAVSVSVYYYGKPPKNKINEEKAKEE